MARLSIAGAPASDTTAINLARMIARLQNTLLKPDATTEQRLITSPYERSKVSANIDYARQLLLRLEQEGALLKVHSKKAEIQADLLMRRDMIQTLSERLHELNTYQHAGDVDSSTDEDLICDLTQEEDIDLMANDHSTDSRDPHPSDHDRNLSLNPESDIIVAPVAVSSDRDRLFPSIRARHTFPIGQDTGHSTDIDIASSTLNDQMLTHHRTEQEGLTADLLGMAQALKKSSTSFSRSLEDEDEILRRATEGLERNVGGLEIASRRMGVLRRMSEGRGWFGRMGLYAAILAMWVLAVLIVGVLPKLRF